MWDPSLTVNVGDLQETSKIIDKELIILLFIKYWREDVQYR